LNLQALIDNLGTPVIVTMLGLVVNFARSMSRTMEEMAVSVRLMQQELHIKMTHVDEQVSDHEQRLRIVERKK
jgi:hypothetical protein